jgi:hypothetical protein
MEIPIKESYETLREIVKDVSDIVSTLSKWKTMKLIGTYKRGISGINALAMQVIAQVETAKKVHKEIEFTQEDREKIVVTIVRLSEELNEIIKTDAVKCFLGSHPGLGDKVYLKMYGESEDYLPDDIYSNQHEFIDWIYRVHKYIDDIIEALDKCMCESQTGKDKLTGLILFIIILLLGGGYLVCDRYFFIHSPSIKLLGGPQGLTQVNVKFKPSSPKAVVLRLGSPLGSGSTY